MSDYECSLPSGVYIERSNEQINQLPGDLSQIFNVAIPVTNCGTRLSLHCVTCVTYHISYFQDLSLPK
jgi:hypothetical protein